jgi:hypothetical protein
MRESKKRSKKNNRICLKRGVILKYNAHSTAENHYWFYPDSNWRSFGTLEEMAPGLFEPLHTISDMQI